MSNTYDHVRYGIICLPGDLILNILDVNAIYKDENNPDNYYVRFKNHLQNNDYIIINKNQYDLLKRYLLYNRNVPCLNDLNVPNYTADYPNNKSITFFGC